LDGRFIATAAILVSFPACRGATPPMPDSAPAAAATHTSRGDIEEVIYDGGLQNGWQDWGWSPKEIVRNGPAKIHFDNYGGWMLAKPGLHGDFGGVVVRVMEPPGEGEFIEIHLLSTTGAHLGKVNVLPDDRVDVGDGWTEIFVPIDRLDPKGTPFDRVVVQAFRPFDGQPVAVDKIALTKGGAQLAGAGATPAPGSAAAMSIDCRAKATRISPLIYGVAGAGGVPSNHAASSRWGGNLSSTYNRDINAWNAGNDWFFENRESESAGTFLHDNASHGAHSALTVPMMGWIAKDKTSWSYPVSALGPQEKTDPYRSDAGNGKDKRGKPLSTTPERAYVAITPDYVRRWVEAIRKEDAKTGKRSVEMYILDNEPMLWSTTHRDAHPEPVSYDELVTRTIDYATVIRQADPDALIAGPAEWGWTGYLYSAKDTAAGNTVLRPDRRAHGDVPLVAYYLKALADHEKKTGVRLLDVFDLHSYPMADGVYSDAVDANTAALRIRSTRLLWDPNYVDESWVKEPIKLLPRMHEWVDQNYPGRGLSIGEWSFGGEQHMSGALAIAETFGRFAQFGVTSAFYWTSPPVGSPGMWAFRAYRDYDGKGSGFLDWFTPGSVDHVGQQSLFASRDDSGKHLVAVVLNFSPTSAAAAQIELGSCGNVASVQSYTYTAGAKGFTAGATQTGATTKVAQTLPPYSITILDVQLDGSSPLTK
jgi:Glycoside hydrolase family 44